MGTANCFYCRVVENVNFRHLLKTDDDCFVDVNRILTRLEELGNVTNTWLGRCVNALSSCIVAFTRTGASLKNETRQSKY
jgi:hypothetical protein